MMSLFLSFSKAVAAWYASKMDVSPYCFINVSATKSISFVVSMKFRLSIAVRAPIREIISSSSVPSLCET